VELLLGAEEEVRAAAPGDPAAGPAGNGPWAVAVVHRVAYDVETVARAMVAAGLPETLAAALVEA